jgi:hypothetical protein
MFGETMAKRKINFELIAALAATLTAIAAVVVAVVQTDIMRKEAEMEREHARISVMPSLMFSYSNGNTSNGKKFLELNIENMGLGPAIIEEFNIKYKGRELPNQSAWVQEVVDQLRSKEVDVSELVVINSSVGAGRVIPADGLVRPIRVEHDEVAVALRQAFSETNFTICGCSVYGDCQIILGMGHRPENIPDCKAEDDGDDAGE